MASNRMWATTSTAAFTARTADPSYPTSKIDTQPIRTQSPLNGAWQEVVFWNGQFGAGGPNEGTKDRWRDGSPQEVNHLGYAGLEAQAIAALETHRMSGGAEGLAAAYPEYRRLFDAAFSDWPADRRASRETAGLAIAAYERRGSSSPVSPSRTPSTPRPAGGRSSSAPVRTPRRSASRSP